MKSDFIKSIENYKGESYDLEWKTIQELPNCYAKGYLVAKFTQIHETTDNIEELKECLLECAEYDIWK